MSTPILMPSVEPSMRAGRVMRWLRREGDFVETGEPVAEIAADRTTMDVESPSTGVLVRILAEAGGDEIAVDSAIGLIEAGPAPHVSPRPADGPAHHQKPGRTPVSPRAKRLAHEAGFDLSQIDGSGPNGRIVENDVLAALAARAREVHAPHPLAAHPLAANLLAANPLTTHRLAAHPLRDAAAAVEADGAAEAPPLAPAEFSAQNVPLVHLEAESRVDALESMRAKLNEAAQAEKSTRISLVDCVVKAWAMALRRTPRANIAYAPGGFVQARHADVALALPGEGGMVAPALAEAEHHSLGEIAAARTAFLGGSRPHAALQGGSSLVANFGAMGVKRAFPVLVAPWTSLLSIGLAEKTVVVEDGVPDVATVMSVTLTFDRRAMDEVTGAALLRAFKALVENPYGLLL